MSFQLPGSEVFRCRNRALQHEEHLPGPEYQDAGGRVPVIAVEKETNKALWHAEGKKDTDEVHSRLYGLFQPSKEGCFRGAASSTAPVL